MKTKRRSHRPMKQAQIEEIFSLTREQLLEMSLVDLARRGDELLIRQGVAAEIETHLKGDCYQSGDGDSRAGRRNGARPTVADPKGRGLGDPQRVCKRRQRRRDRSH